MKRGQFSNRGFTIVELLVVIVVIAILAAITVVAYNGIQARARDAQRVQDIKTIAKALELYYADNGTYPNSSCSLGAGCRINSGWDTTADASWQNLADQLVPTYISALPKEPQPSASGDPAIYGGFNYDYLRMTSGSWCNTSATKPMYMLGYRLESGSQKTELLGDCPGTQPTNYQSSEYMAVK
jgi:type II secretion system protein G